ncbi:MAG: DinB family protein [Gemmatimonadales bacterium]
MKSRPVVLTALALIALPGAAAAQHVASVRNLHETARTWLVKSAEQMPDSLYGFKPTPEVRSFGGIIGHVADANYLFCSIVKGEESPATQQYEKVTDRAALIKALKDAFAYCDAAYQIADAQANDHVSLPFGNLHGSRLWALTFNVAHNNEHYGNLVTYFRLKGMVPPSTQQSGM